MRYLVISCTGCGWPRVAQGDKETAQCPRCGTRIPIDRAIVHARTDELEAAQNAVGQVNAQRADGELAEAAVQEVPDRDPIDKAVRQARKVTSERTQVQLAAEGLTEAFSTFTEDQWIEALGRLDVPRGRAVEHLERLKQASVLVEPTAGEHRHVG